MPHALACMAAGAPPTSTTDSGRDVVCAAGTMALQQYEYVRSPQSIEATKATEHTLDRGEIYQLLTPAM